MEAVSVEDVAPEPKRRSDQASSRKRYVCRHAAAGYYHPAANCRYSLLPLSAVASEDAADAVISILAALSVVHALMPFSSHAPFVVTPRFHWLKEESHMQQSSFEQTPAACKAAASEHTRLLELW